MAMTTSSSTSVKPLSRCRLLETEAGKDIRTHFQRFILLTARLSAPEGPAEPGGFDFRRMVFIEGPVMIGAILSGVEVEERVSLPNGLAVLYMDRRDHTGPFDIIGDVHGCHGELVRLLHDLGWQVDESGTDAVHPDGRTAVFLGDLVDRGPASPAVLRLAMTMAAAGRAICLPGNHENKLQRALAGRKVTPSHGLAETLAQLAAEPESWRQDVERWLDGLVSHAVLDGGPGLHGARCSTRWAQLLCSAYPRGKY